MRIGAITFRWSEGLCRVSCFFDKAPRMVSVLICDLWENIPVPHAPFQIPHPTSHILHSTFHILHSTFHIHHSTFSTPLPQIYTLFPVAPRPASKYAILSAFSQLSNNQPFTIRALPRHLPNTPFPTTKRHFSTHDPCPFEAPSLTFRPSIPKPPQPDTCPTPASPFAYGLSTRSHSASQTSKPRLPALCFTQNSDTRFAPNIFNVVWFSSYRLLGVERGMIYQVDSWIDGLGMMQKCNERSTFAVVAQSAAVEQATE